MDVLTTTREKAFHHRRPSTEVKPARNEAVPNTMGLEEARKLLHEMVDKEYAEL